MPHDLMACPGVNVGSVSRQIPMITGIVVEPSTSSCCILPSQNKSSKTRSSTLDQTALRANSLCDLNRGDSNLSYCSYMGTVPKATTTSLRQLDTARTCKAPQSLLRREQAKLASTQSATLPLASHHQNVVGATLVSAIKHTVTSCFIHLSRRLELNICPILVWTRRKG